MPFWRILLCSAAFLILTPRHARAAEPATPDPNLARRLADIRRLLASDDFASRETGQKQLDLIPPGQLATLRDFADHESDPEVKARLDARLDAMRLYILIHPKNLSLDVDNQTLDHIMQDLDRQIDLRSSSLVGRPGGGNPTYSLHAQDLPFWQILEQLNRQSPFLLAGRLSVGATGTINSLQVTPSANARNFSIHDTFALVDPLISGNPATGSWSLNIQGFSDPRVRIIRYSPLRIEKISDQNGASLISLLTSNSNNMTTASRPTTYWSSAATFSVAPGALRIQELRGGIALSILESEQSYTIDLTKPPAPIDTPRGQITVEKDAKGNAVFHLTPKPGQAGTAPATPTVIRSFDDAGKPVSNYSTTATEINVTFANANLVQFEVSWPDKSRDMLLPVELHDLVLPAVAPQAEGLLDIPRH